MKLPVHGVSELVLEVGEMERAVEFWSETLGFPVVDEWSYVDGQFAEATDGDTIWATWLYLGGNTRLGLWLPRELTEDELNQSVSSWPDSAIYDEGGEHVHFALYVESPDLDAAHHMIEQAGVSTTIRDYEDSPRRSLYFKDSENNVVELYTLSMAEEYHSDNLSLNETSDCGRS